MKRLTIAAVMVCLFALLATADYAQPKNMWEGTLDANYVEGTDTEISIGDTTGWPTSGVVLIDDGTEWILVRYDSVDGAGHDLETLSDADADFDSTSGQGHTFNSGTSVILAQAADYNRQIVEDITEAAADAIFYEGSNEIDSSANFTFDETTLTVTAAAGSAGTLNLSSDELTVEDGDILGQIDFQAPSESDGTDAIVVAASIWAEADDTFAVDNNSTELCFATAASGAVVEHMRIDHDGNVGIGTTSPAGLLHIAKDQDAVTDIVITNAGTGTASRTRISTGEDMSTKSCSFGYANNSWNPGAGVESIPANSVYLGTASGATGGFSIISAASGGNIRLYTGGYAAANERMRIDSSGNVGIGTTAPSFPLQLVSGTFPQVVVSNVLTDATNKYAMYGAGHYTTAEEPISMMFMDSTVGTSSVFFGGGASQMNAVTKIEFYTAANTTTTVGSSRMIINSSGNVGIGTTSPSGNLDVNAATDADAHILLSENDATKWDLYNDHNDDYLQLMSGSTLRYEFGTDGTAVADVAWNTFSPEITAVGRELLDVAMEDAGKPVKPYDGIPIVVTDEELAAQSRSVRLPNEFQTQELRDAEVARYGKNTAEIAIASARYLAYLTEALEAQGIEIPELPEEIAELKSLAPKGGMSAGEIAGSIAGAFAAGGAAVGVIRRKKVA